MWQKQRKPTKINSVLSKYNLDTCFTYLLPEYEKNCLYEYSNGDETVAVLNQNENTNLIEACNNLVDILLM